MKTLLSYSEMLEHKEGMKGKTPGLQFNVNHDSCGDTKRRLNRSNNATGILFHCFNCGASGFLRTDGGFHRIGENSTVLAPNPANAHVTWINAVKFHAWPMEAVLWWYSYELDESDTLVYGARWHEDMQRLVLRAAGGYLYQARAFFKTPNKYVTWKVRDEPLLSVTDPNNAVFIVEDLVSSYKLHKAGANVLCLTGTSASDKDIAAITQFDSAVIWLDNVVAGREGASKLYSKICHMRDVEVMFNMQPKEIEFTALKNTVAYANV